MVQLKEFVLFVIFLVHSNVAINLNIFSFNRAPIKNVTESDTSIQSTVTLTNSIEITRPPTTTDSSDLVIDPLPTVDYEKHEFENETEGSDSSPEITAGSSPPVQFPAGQEIDETRNSSRYSVTENPDESTSSDLMGRFTLTPGLPSIPKITLPKLPSLPKKKTVTFTKTLVSKITEYETVHPSCLKLQDVRSTCDGTLITIQPTPTLLSHDFTQTNVALPDEGNISYDVVEPPENRKRRTINTTSGFGKDSLNKPNPADMIESSEPDYEFEFQPDDTSHPTPTSEKLLGGLSKPHNFIESLLINEPKIEFVTDYLFITAVQTVTDYAVTATVIAHDCLPSNINIKSCPKSPHVLPTIPILPPATLPILPILYSQNMTTKRPNKMKNIQPKPPHVPPTIAILPILHSQNMTTKRPNEVKEIQPNHQQMFFLPSAKPDEVLPPAPQPQKPYNILEQLNQYLIMNAERLIGTSGYETVDLNAESTIIEPEPEYPLHLRAKRTN